ncbi:MULTISPECIES: hypothetical protein [unclassified Rhodococcus (in: high G+C Gram-positive bacteria)]|jgi:hypothetical protein|uniref:hypothetical protein n=1 Tax=unclassified Rhodococcus (in: high G+C Gram-positive bacteria) TaxID=192944 RepID=UPI000B3C5034|nr:MULTISPECIES: hypothetical protein [unclassified Rhodococcus (in: high G+C Gram-positive bacteria)]KAF0961409.1 hypothetical protein MLGJGCBP_05551 [Rhodococcus sp. T7]OUS84363.1 hypothetical protein CA951_40055 [Rhodococcus sp. NCIMB 12038]
MRTSSRRWGLLSAAAAAIVGVGVIAGCGAAIEGTAQQNDSQAAEYAAEATSSSVAASSSQKAAAEREALVEQCTMFVTRAGETIDTYNTFIDAANAEAADTGAKASAAAAALRSAADGANAATPALPPDLTGLLTDYANNYRELAAAVDGGQRGDILNTLASRGDELSDSIRAACPTS